MLEMRWFGVDPLPQNNALLNWDITGMSTEFTELMPTSQNQTGGPDIVLNQGYKLPRPTYISIDANGIDLHDNTTRFYKDGDYVGYISKYTANLSRKINVVMTISKMEQSYLYDFNANGITLMFHDNYSTEFTIQAFGYEGNLLNQETYHPQFETGAKNLNYFCDFEANEWYKLVLSFTEMDAAFSLLKIDGIVFGKIRIFSQFAEVNFSEDVDVLSADLPVGDLNVTFVSDEPLDLDSGGDVVLYNNGEIVSYNFADELTQNGKSIYSLNAYNSIGMFEKTYYEFPYIDGRLVYNNESWQSTRCNIDPLFVGKMIYGVVPPTSFREIITLMAFALGGYVDSWRTNIPTIRPLPTAVSSTIMTSDNRIIGDAIYKKRVPYSKAKLSRYTYIKGEGADEEVWRGYNTNSYSNVEVFFSEFWYDFTYWGGDVATWIMGDTPYSVLFSVQAGGAGDPSIHAKRYINQTNIIEIINPDISNPDENVLTLDKYAIFCPERIEAVKENIRKYMASKGTVTGKIVLRDEKPGDLITIETAFSGIKTGIITKMAVTPGYDNVADIEVLEWPAG